MIDRTPVARADSSRPGASPTAPAAPQLSWCSRAAWVGALVVYLIWLGLLGWLAWQTRS